MASQLQTTAEIIPFPVDRRNRSTREKTGNSAANSSVQPHVAADELPAMEFGAGWYHDQAMADANLSRN